MQALRRRGIGGIKVSRNNEEEEAKVDIVSKFEECYLHHLKTDTSPESLPKLLALEGTQRLRPADIEVFYVYFMICYVYYIYIYMYIRNDK